jgi:hypothetical protein
MSKPEPVIFGYTLSALRDLAVNRQLRAEVTIGPFRWRGRNLYEFVIVECAEIEFRHQVYCYCSTISNAWDFKYFMHFDPYEPCQWDSDYGVMVFKWIHKRAAHYVDEDGVALEANREFQMMMSTNNESVSNLRIR